ncbi:MAG: UDP-3-O-(3-hydroxymyristoyl)glucosamine N-acyltransferase [Elusimicrobia bacterium]|nr:UDP-3-O-(3-hydroxymyristoyl)glucosamine N-acyltransferase [Elusimicrobiota bacterium]
MNHPLLKILETIGPATLEGDAHFEVRAPATLKDAEASDIALFSSDRYADDLTTTRAGAILAADKLRPLTEHFRGRKIFVPNIMLAWAKLLALWERSMAEAAWGIDPAAHVARTVRLGKNVSVGALAVIEDRVEIGDGTVIHPQCFIGRDVSIGAHCIIYPQAVIRERCKIGDRAIIHSGAVIGSDGFGFVTVEGRHEKIPQIGTVEIGNDVEIGANTTIDRATVGATKINDGSKIDNQIQIAHNVVVGKGCLFAAQVGIAGSSSVGDYVVMGGQVGVRDHVRIAGGTMIGGQAGIISDVKEKDILWGTPSRNHREALKLQVLYNKLPEIYESVKKLLKAAGLDNDDGKVKTGGRRGS